jgi:hypothetical protein
MYCYFKYLLSCWRMEFFNVHVNVTFFVSIVSLYYTRSPFLTLLPGLARRYVILFQDTGEVHQITFSFFFTCYFI